MSEPQIKGMNLSYVYREIKTLLLKLYAKPPNGSEWATWAIPSRIFSSVKNLRKTVEEEQYKIILSKLCFDYFIELGSEGKKAHGDMLLETSIYQL